MIAKKTIAKKTQPQKTDDEIKALMPKTARWTEFIICRLQFCHTIKLISESKIEFRVKLLIKPRDIGTVFKANEKEFIFMFNADAYMTMCNTFEHGHELINVSCQCPEEIFVNLSKINLLACTG